MCNKIVKQLIACFMGFLLIAPTIAVQAKEITKTNPAKQTLSPTEQRKLDYFFYEALKLKQAYKFDAAFDLFTHCLSIDSTAAPVLYELSHFYVQLDKSTRAVDLLKRAVAYSNNNFTYKMALASVTRKLGMYSEASQEFEQLVKENPSKPELNFYLADTYSQQGEIEKAIGALNKLEENMGMNENISMQKYKLYNSINDEAKALNELDKLANKFATQARYQIMIGDLMLEKNDTTQAAQRYAKAYEIEPTNPYYIVSMANYYEHVGNKEAAETQIESALINSKLDIDTKIGILSRYIMRLQQSKKGTDSANELFKTLIEQHPNETKLNMMYGALLELQKKIDEAKFQFQLVTELQPDNDAAWKQLLSLALKSEDIPEVIRICKKGQELFPAMPEFYFYLGIAYYQEKEYQQAIETYQQGVKVIDAKNTPLLSDFYGQIGDIYYQLNDLDKAYQAYDKALEYNEQNAVVLNNYSYFLTLNGGDLSKAERMSAKSVKLHPDNATYLDTYAWIFFRQGNYTLAKIYIENAINKDTEKSGEVIEHYGDILYKMGDKEKALEQWQKAKELKSDSKTLDKKIETQTYIDNNDEAVQ